VAKYILLSGPPGAGKDTVGNLIAKVYGAEPEKFAQPLMDAASSLGFDMREAHKEDCTGPGSMSRRQFQIEFSERFCKPVLGLDVFGRALAKRARRMSEGLLFVVTDSGFLSEAVALAEEVGRENIRRIHLHRPGHDYSRDSRSDWNSSDLGIVRVDITNDGSVDQLKGKLLAALTPWADWVGA